MGVEDYTRGTELRVQPRQKVVGLRELHFSFLSKPVDKTGVLSRHAGTCLNLAAGSQFGNICNAGLVFYTRGVKDGNFCKVRCQLSVQLWISSAAFSRSFAGRQFAERTE